MSKNIQIRKLLMICFAIEFISRILVITGNYTLPFDSRIIDIFFLCICILLGTFGMRKLIISYRSKTVYIIVFLLVLYTILFGYVLVNPLMKDFTRTMFQRQIIFIAIISATSWIIIRYRFFDEFLKVMFVSISIVLIIQFIKNFSDVTYLNITSMLMTKGRTRGNFGFGHYNTLGGTCVANIIIGLLIRKRGRYKKKFGFFIFLSSGLSLLMLMVSASRSSITGLIIYLSLYAYMSVELKGLSYKAQRNIKIAFIIIIIGGVIFSIDVPIKEVLKESNRSAIIDISLPIFWNSDRTMIGLGWVPNEMYGLNMTPYNTRWLDNGYIYTLITTGYLGFGIYTIIHVIIAKNILSKSKASVRIHVICVFVLYLYTAIFEATLMSGLIQNYTYITLFLVYISGYFEKEID